MYCTFCHGVRRDCPHCGLFSPEKDNNFNTFNLPLDGYGGKGYSLNERIDFSGHRSGLVVPHVNVDLLGSSEQKVFINGRRSDLTSNQLPGFNKLIF